MKLVKYENYKLEVEPELLLLKPFRTLYNADKTVDKHKFYDFLCILYFTYDPRSDYSYITNDELRLQEVCDANGFKLPTFNAKEKECISIYRQMTITTSSELLKSAQVAIDKVRDFLENIDMNATDDKGKLLIPINTVTSALKAIPQLAKDIQKAYKSVTQELEEETRVKGAKNKTMFEEGIKF